LENKSEQNNRTPNCRISHTAWCGRPSRPVIAVLIPIGSGKVIQAAVLRNHPHRPKQLDLQHSSSPTVQAAACTRNVTATDLECAFNMKNVHWEVSKTPRGSEYVSTSKRPTRGLFWPRAKVWIYCSTKSRITTSHGAKKHQTASRFERVRNHRPVVKDQ